MKFITPRDVLLCDFKVSPYCATHLLKEPSSVNNISWNESYCFSLKFCISLTVFFSTSYFFIHFLCFTTIWFFLLFLSIPLKLVPMTFFIWNQKIQRLDFAWDYLLLDKNRSFVDINRCRWFPTRRYIIDFNSSKHRSKNL